jgi:hypothetical protein
VTLGRSAYYISYYLIYLSPHDSPSSFPPFVLIWAGGVYGANEGSVNNGELGGLYKRGVGVGYATGAA